MHICINIVATLENNINHFIPLISNEKEILLFPLFPYKSPYHHLCKESGECDLAFEINISYYVDGNQFLELNKNLLKIHQLLKIFEEDMYKKLAILLIENNWI